MLCYLTALIASCVAIYFPAACSPLCCGGLFCFISSAVSTTICIKALGDNVWVCNITKGAWWSVLVWISDTQNVKVSWMHLSSELFHSAVEEKMAQLLIVWTGMSLELNLISNRSHVWCVRLSWERGHDWYDRPSVSLQKEHIYSL